MECTQKSHEFPETFVDVHLSSSISSCINLKQYLMLKHKIKRPQNNMFLMIKKIKLVIFSPLLFYLLINESSYDAYLLPRM